MQKKEDMSWSGVETWAVRIIDQSKEQAKRWFIAWIITLAALVGTNAAWLYVFQSYEYVSQDGTGSNNINMGSQENVMNGTEDEN